MKLCDWHILKQDNPENRCPAGPLRDTAAPNQLRCHRCGGWTPHGGLPSPERVTILVAEAISLLTELALAPKQNYRWAHGVAFDPTRRSNGGGARTGHGDPTGARVADPRRAMVRDAAIVAARLLERAVRDLRNADDAIGQALFAAEPPGPADHVQAPFHDPASLFPGRPDLEDSHAAQGRRWGRGEL